MKVKKEKKVKLEPLPRIKRRLLKKWSEAVRSRDDFSCCFCQVKKGDISKFNPEKTTNIDAHHILQKEIKDCPLKYDMLDGISLCKSHHKFDGTTSAHKSPVVFYEWYRLTYPDRYEYILKNSHVRVDLDNRKILEEIEKCLDAKQPLDLPKLLEIEKMYPRVINTKPELKGNLFEQLADDVTDLSTKAN